MPARRKLLPIVVDGVMRPDLDHRYVPGELLAQYLGLSRTTVYEMTSDGSIPASAYISRGRKRPIFRYRPSALCPTNAPQENAWNPLISSSPSQPAQCWRISFPLVPGQPTSN